ncbi:putative nuclease HARBI1 [Ixodes scapularis]
MRTARGFADINGFPKVLRCIDGTHIALKIAKKDQNIYRNRKGYDSLNVQAVCTASNEITQPTVKWPESTHDSFMWRNCDLSEKFEAGGMPDGWLLGDAGYPLQPWLMTLFRKPKEEEGEEAYNMCLTKTRQVIERTFGILKSRFPCLDRSGGVLQYTPSVCCRIIVACVVLHNYCIRHHVSLTDLPVVESDEEEEEEEEDEEDRPSTARDTPAGIVTGRCVNDRIREHQREITKDEADSQHAMRVHLRACAQCSPTFPTTSVLGAHKNRYGREILESFAIKRAPRNISSPSLLLSEREMTFLGPELATLTARTGGH